MLKMMMMARHGVRGLVKNERGVLAIEYALLVAFIGLVIIAGITVVGTKLNTWYTDIGTFIGTIATGL